MKEYQLYLVLYYFGSSWYYFGGVPNGGYSNIASSAFIEAFWYYVNDVTNKLNFILNIVCSTLSGAVFVEAYGYTGNSKIYGE